MNLSVSNLSMAAAYPGIRPDVLDDSLTQRVFSHYQETLLMDIPSHNFLLSLGIPMSIAERYGVGYSDRSLGLKIPLGKTKEGAAIRGSLQRRRLLKNSGHELFRGSLVVPILDRSGNAIAAYGYRTASRLSASTDPEVYWSETGNQPLFNALALSEQPSIVLCQNPLDALVLISAGYSNVIATLGLKRFSDDHLSQLSQARTKNVTVVFENTEANQVYSRLMAQSLHSEGILCRQAVLPKGMTLIDFVRRSDSVSRALRRLFSHTLDCRQSYESLRRAAYV